MLSPIRFRGILPLIILGLGLGSCSKSMEGPENMPTYLFMGHTRTENPRVQRVLPEVENLDLKPYDLLMLGGDITFNTTVDTASVAYVDSLFDLGNPHTLVAPGNHDAHNYDLLTHFTGRPTYFTYHQDGITFLVLNTQEDSCNMSGAQLDLIRTVTDTLRESDQLLVLHHKLMWMADHPELKNRVSQVPNAGFCAFSYCLFPNNFYQDVYPLLKQVQERGIQVVLLGGDVGIKVKYFEHQTPDGIWFIASGMNEGDADNQALILTKNAHTKELTWKSILLSDLPKSK